MIKTTAKREEGQAENQKITVNGKIAAAKVPREPQFTSGVTAGAKGGRKQPQNEERTGK